MNETHTQYSFIAAFGNWLISPVKILRQRLQLPTQTKSSDTCLKFEHMENVHRMSDTSNRAKMGHAHNFAAAVDGRRSADLHGICIPFIEHYDSILIGYVITG
jgi:hypothetical protein